MHINFMNFPRPVPAEGQGFNFGQLIYNGQFSNYPLINYKMSSFFNRQSNTLLGHLNSNGEMRIRQSQSSEYTEPHFSFELDRVYQDLLSKMEKSKLILGQDYEIHYRTESQSGKIAYIKMVLDYFTNKYLKPYYNQQEDGQIECGDCKNYENLLQKLENDIRQHIRLEQQLKLYQESLEEKIQQQKKMHLQIMAKNEDELNEWKAKERGLMHKIARLEEQHEKSKHEVSKNKSGLIAEHSHRTIRESSQTKSFKVLQQMKQMKENVVVQKSGHKKEEKKQDKKDQKQKGRKSVEKRPNSSEKWRYSNVSSNKHFPLGEKQIAEKNKQERRKAIQAKFELRR